MKRTLATLVLLLGLLQASGFLPGSAPGLCRDVCPGDDPAGDCPPFCDECVCCSSPAASAAVEPARQTGPASTRALGAVESRTSPEPSPREIAHIPKPALS